MNVKEVILVDENDNQTGIMEKMEAHRLGLLHRAFSVFIFNNEGSMLIHQRATGKYHGGGLWTNACCSHPMPGEEADVAASRRLMQEMGIACPLQHAFTFTYKAAVENGLTEHEIDHVYTGVYHGNPQHDSDEVQDWKWMPLQELKNDMEARPQHYTTWFRIALPLLEEHLPIQVIK
ncbi:MAG: isopentenyl-diphosphate Delta-isomerase [Flavobacteriales bacterium]